MFSVVALLAVFVHVSSGSLEELPVYGQPTGKLCDDLKFIRSRVGDGDRSYSLALTLSVEQGNVELFNKSETLRDSKTLGSGLYSTSNEPPFPIRYDSTPIRPDYTVEQLAFTDVDRWRSLVDGAFGLYTPADSMGAVAYRTLPSLWRTGAGRQMTLFTDRNRKRGSPVGVLTIGGHDTKNCLSDFRYARQVSHYPSFTITKSQLSDPIQDHLETPAALNRVLCATFGKRARGYSIKTGLGLGEVSAEIAPDFGLVKVPKYAFDWIVADVGGNVTYDEKSGVYRVDCQKALRLKDNLTLTHGAVRNKGLAYEPVFDFVLRRGDMVKANREKTRCMLTVTDKNDNVPPTYRRDAWVLGTPFLENYCVFFNWLADNDHGVAIAPSKLSGLTF